MRLVLGVFTVLLSLTDGAVVPHVESISETLVAQDGYNLESLEESLMECEESMFNNEKKKKKKKNQPKKSQHDEATYTIDNIIGSSLIRFTSIVPSDYWPAFKMYVIPTDQDAKGHEPEAKWELGQLSLSKDSTGFDAIPMSGVRFGYASIDMFKHLYNATDIGLILETNAFVNWLDMVDMNDLIWSSSNSSLRAEFRHEHVIDTTDPRGKFYTTNFTMTGIQLRRLYGNNYNNVVRYDGPVAEYYGAVGDYGDPEGGITDLIIYGYHGIYRHDLRKEEIVTIGPFFNTTAMTNRDEYVHWERPFLCQPDEYLIGFATQNDLNATTKYDIPKGSGLTSLRIVCA